MAETYNNLYLDTRRALKANGVEAASLEAMELVAGAAGVRRSQLQRDLQLYAGSQVERRLAEMIGRRLTGEPLPYVSEVVAVNVALFDIVGEFIRADRSGRGDRHRTVAALAADVEDERAGAGLLETGGTRDGPLDGHGLAGIDGDRRL